MSEEAFDAAFRTLVEPMLVAHGFRAVIRPDGWIAPEKLFESNDRWFAASWDWRDRYLSADLGRLFRFRDVLPRVIVRGPFATSVACTEQEVAPFLASQLARIAAALPEAIRSFDQRLEESLRADATVPPGSTKKARRNHAEYRVRLGPPLALRDWSGCRIVPPPAAP